MGEWENLVPSKNTSIQDYTPSGVQQKNEDEGPDVELRGKVEIKKKKWFERCASDFKKYFPKMLFGVAIPEMGKILITKTFDVIYSSIFNEPYSGGGKPGGKGYFFSNGSVVDYDNFFDKKNGNNAVEEVRHFAHSKGGDGVLKLPGGHYTHCNLGRCPDKPVELVEQHWLCCAVVELIHMFSLFCWFLGMISAFSPYLKGHCLFCRYYICIYCSI